MEEVETILKWRGYTEPKAGSLKRVINLISLWESWLRRKEREDTNVRSKDKMLACKILNRY